jgi:UDP-GlcNAc:undecaprenyl-phosphate GlcNAc-1-phosphate transferase
VVNVGLALAAVEVFGMHIDFLSLGLLRVHNLGLLILPITVLWIIGMQNTVNLLDGVDGLAAGVVGIVAVVLMIAAAGKLGVSGQRQVLVLCGILAATCVGFLVFNFHPARIFMGDSGSQFLGTVLALLSILGVAKVTVAAALLVPVLALAIPIADTAWAIVRRRRNGISVAHADSKHVHHRLLNFGLTQPETCVVFYGATGILGAVGLAVYGHKRILAAAIVFMVVIISTLLGERLQLWDRRLPIPGGRILRLVLEGRTTRD